MAPKFTQANRSLEIRTPLGENVLGLRSIAFQETIGRPFLIEAALSSEDPELAIDSILGRPVVVRLDLPGGRRRFFHAFVSRFVAEGRGPLYAHYRATLVPWLWVLTRSADCRIFHDTSVPDIIQTVFTDRGEKEFESRLSETYVPKEYCVQYRETDFDFVSRLMEEEGIYYFFQHTEDKVTLALVDSVESCEPAAGCEELEFEETHAGDLQGERVVRWTVEKEVEPTQYAVADYNPLRPRTDLKVMQEGPREHAINDRQVFDYPGEYRDPQEGEHIARMRIDELQSGGEVVRAETRCLGLSCGNTFTLRHHPREDQNRKYLVTSMNLFWDAGEFHSEDQGPPRQHCEFTAIPASQTYRPRRITPRPLIQGPQPAVVVGPEGEEIHTDEYGRVKVHFYWNRESEGEAAVSCWVRVAQNWAGKRWGTFFLPRIGHEVLVDFYEADPDRPIITGSVYNAVNTPPYELPAEKTKSTLKSLSSKGGEGFNELRFEDLKGGEQLFVHAQKNADIRVRHDTFEWIGNNRHLIVKNDRIEHVENNRDETVDADHKEAIGKDRHLKVAGKEAKAVDGSKSLTVKGDVIEVFRANHSEQTTDDYYLKADNVCIEAMTNLTLKVGPTTLAMEAGGLGIKTTGQVKIAATGPVKVESAATAELTSPTTSVKGEVTVIVQGAIVMIN